MHHRHRRFFADHLCNFMPHSLFMAITRGDINTVQKYINSNQNDRHRMNARTFTTSLTPLMLAVRTQQFAIVEMFLANNLTDVNFCNGNGKSAISIAILENNYKLICLLLADPRINLQGIHSKILEWAVSNGHDHIVTQLTQSADAQICVNHQLSFNGMHGC